jgi:hypothetical protein
VKVYIMDLDRLEGEFFIMSFRFRIVEQPSPGTGTLGFVTAAEEMFEGGDGVGSVGGVTW